MGSAEDRMQALRDATIACAKAAEQGAVDNMNERAEGFANAAKALAEASEMSYKAEVATGGLT
jgi:hypothetical protein